MRQQNEVEKFISSFHGDSKEVFTRGKCYWFAFILCNEFQGKLYYSEKENHFVAMIGDKFYDITGDVTNKYNDLILFENYLEKERIQRDCCH